MPETKLIPTVTSLKVINSIIEIFTQFLKIACDTIQVFLSSVVGTLGGVSFKEGELVIEMDNSPDNIDFFVDTDGNLIATGLNSNHYAINSLGELICNPSEDGVGYDEVEKTLIVYI